MKPFNKIMMLLVVICSYGMNTFSYNFTFVNETGKNVKIQLYAGSAGLIKLNEKSVQIKSNDPPHTFEFAVGKSKGKAGLCLGKIMVSIKERGWRQWK